MTDVRFEWDPRKSRTNKAKHGVSFEEARPRSWTSTLESSRIRSTQTMRNGLCSSA